MTTPEATDGLRERLLNMANGYANEEAALLEDAADALDAKDAEIRALLTERDELKAERDEALAQINVVSLKRHLELKARLLHVEAERDALKAQLGRQDA